MRKILAPLLLALLAISLVPLVHSHDNDGDDDEHEEERVKRELHIDTSPTTILVRSKIENGTVENEFGLLFTTKHRSGTDSGTGIVIHVAFSHETEVGDVENEAFLHLRIAYLNLVEFEDTNGNAAFDVGEEVRTIDLRNVTYAPLQPPTRIADDNGQLGWRLRATTTDRLFQVTADIFQNFAVVNGTIVPPTATKITTIIDGFGFSSSSSRVALQVMAVSRMVLEHETQITEEEIRVRSATAQGFFTWARTAIVDGRTEPVTDSLQRLEDSRRWIINLAYPQGSSIIHDPILGFDELGTTPILTSRLLIGAAIGAVAVFGALIYLGRRQLAKIANPRSLCM